MTASTIERRCVEQPAEFRAAGDDSAFAGVLTGYGPVFNKASRDLGGFVEIIEPTGPGAPLEGGALDLSLHTRVMARTNHDSNLLLGTTDATPTPTLRLFVDEVGVRYEIDVPPTSYGRDLVILAKRGDIRFSSFAFRTAPGGDTWGYDSDDRLVRRVQSFTLVDVAPVADPAYWDAPSAMARSFDLDAIRASLQPPPADPGEAETAFRTRWDARIDAHRKEHLG